MNSYAGRQGRGVLYSLFIPWWGLGSLAALQHGFPPATPAPPPRPVRHNWSTASPAKAARRVHLSGVSCVRAFVGGRAPRVGFMGCGIGGLKVRTARDFIGVADYCASDRLLLLRRAKLAICLCNERLAGLLRTIQSPFPFYSLLIVHSPRSSASAVRHQLERNNRTATGGARFFLCFF